jgi:GNAT superfamily N-acetyltransferase
VRLAENKFNIKKIQLKELAGWAASIPSQPAFRKVVPMTLTRALSQSQNPYARQEDVVLLVAFKEDQCIGYHGLLPAVLKHGDNMARVHWATTFYVSPDFRGQGIGKRLLEEIKDFQIDCVVCQITESAQHAYRSSGFQDLGQLSYFQLRVDRLDFLSRFLDAAAGWLRKNCFRAPSRRPGFIHLLQRTVYRLTKRLFYRLAARSGNRRPDRKFTWETVARIDPSLFDELNRPPARVSFYRGPEAVNWMINSPWVISGNKPGEGVVRYYFSDVRDIFRYVAIEIHPKEKGGPLGFLVLSISHKKKKTRVKILDFCFKNPADDEIAVYLALKHARVYLADRIEYPCHLAIYFNRHAKFQKLIKKQSRLYMFYPRSSQSPLAVCRETIALDYCDGDTAMA